MEMATASATDSSGLFVYPTQSRESPFKAKVFEFVCVGGRSFIFNNYLITNPPLAIIYQDNNLSISIKIIRPYLY